MQSCDVRRKGVVDMDRQGLTLHYPYVIYCKIFASIFFVGKNLPNLIRLGIRICYEIVEVIIIKFTFKLLFHICKENIPTNKLVLYNTQ